jgi:hypothetical protein
LFDQRADDFLHDTEVDDETVVANRAVEGHGQDVGVAV